MTVRTATHEGTMGARMPMVQTMAITVGSSESSVVSTSSEYEVMNFVVWLTSEPPKRLVWKVMDWLESVSKQRRARL